MLVIALAKSLCFVCICFCARRLNLCVCALVCAMPCIQAACPLLSMHPCD